MTTHVQSTASKASAVVAPAQEVRCMAGAQDLLAAEQPEQHSRGKGLALCPAWPAPPHPMAGCPAALLFM